jgi:hypothetical protein
MVRRQPSKSCSDLSGKFTYTAYADPAPWKGPPHPILASYGISSIRWSRVRDYAKEDFITQLRIVLRILQAHPVVRALPPPTAEDTRLVHIHTPRALLLLQAQVDTPPVHIRILLAPRLLQAQLVEVRAPTQDTPPAHIRILPAPPLLQTQLAFRRDLRPFMEGNPLALRILMLTPLVPRLLQIRLVFRWGPLMELTRLLPILTRREQLLEPLQAVFRLDSLPPTEAPIRMHIPTPLQQPQILLDSGASAVPQP